MSNSLQKTDIDLFSPFGNPRPDRHLDVEAAIPVTSSGRKEIWAELSQASRGVEGGWGWWLVVVHPFPSNSGIFSRFRFDLGSPDLEIYLMIMEKGDCYWGGQPKL